MVDALGAHDALVPGSVVDPNTFNLDMGNEFWSNLDLNPDPDPGSIRKENLKLTRIIFLHKYFFYLYENVVAGNILIFFSQLSL